MNPRRPQIKARPTRLPSLTAAILLLLPVGLAAQEDPGALPAGNENTVALQVYKKWIGAAGDEANVEIHLYCRPDDNFEPRYINHDLPDGWQITEVPAQGMFCNVREIERDSFVADVSDCVDLLVAPGQDAECTMVNTKVVKRIDMLNRYGLVMMVAVMLGAGLAAVRRFGQM